MCICYRFSIKANCSNSIITFNWVLLIPFAWSAISKSVNAIVSVKCNETSEHASLDVFLLLGFMIFYDFITFFISIGEQFIENHCCFRWRWRCYCNGLQFVVDVVPKHVTRAWLLLTYMRAYRIASSSSCLKLCNQCSYTFVSLSKKSLKQSISRQMDPFNCNWKLILKI